MTTQPAPSSSLLYNDAELREIEAIVVTRVDGPVALTDDPWSMDFDSFTIHVELPDGGRSSRTFNGFSDDDYEALRIAGMHWERAERIRAMEGLDDLTRRRAAAVDVVLAIEAVFPELSQRLPA